MSALDMKQIFQIVKQYASTFGNIDKNAELFELCDFGESYGFLFSTDDKYANLYWCIDKKTYKPFPFRPNMDMQKFMDRKILPIKDLG